jgi:UDP-N-acetylmuramoyl-tripeptide--D-alanyl-D-alanine ligase
MAEPVTWHIRDLVDATGGTLVAGPADGVFAGIGIDSRTVRLDQVFVAIKGERYDGHAFIPSLMESGIRGLIVDRPPSDHQRLVKWAREGGCCILVSDTTRALGDLAAYHRQRMDVPVVAITGSNGKTSTREMAAAVLASERTPLATRGNLNNEFGLPLTLLELDHCHDIAVVELGMNRPGEIDRLGAISAPDTGVITNIGPAHLEGLQTTERIMMAKAELLGHVKRGGTIILNADDVYGESLARLSCSRNRGQRILFFGFSDAAQIRAKDIHMEGIDTEFALVIEGASTGVRLHAPGPHMVANALAAASVGYAQGLSVERIKTGLERFRPVGGRMLHTFSAEGIHVIDDAYNANPGSMKAAIDVLISLKSEGRGVLVAGDMLELGGKAAELHRETGREAAEKGVDRLYVCGEFAEDFAEGALEGGMDASRIYTGEKTDIRDRLREELVPGDWVLVKGSRSTGMDQIANYLIRRKKEA